MDFDLFEDYLHVFLWKGLCVENLASVNFLFDIDGRPDDLLALLVFSFFLEQVCGELSFAYSAKLPLTYYIVVENYVAIDFADFRGALARYLWTLATFVCRS